MISKKKECTSCQAEKYIWKRIEGKPYCQSCSYKVVKPKSISKARKPTGELQVFLEIYQERGPYCQVTGEWLAFNPSHFAHCLSKGSHPSLRLVKENIIQMCFDAHYLFDNSDKETFLKKYPTGSWIYDLKQELKEKYQ